MLLISYMDNTQEEKLKKLVKEALEGDKKAYELFLREVSSIIKKRITRLVLQQNINDLVQTSLLAIHKSLHSVDLQRPILPWIYAITRYKLNDHFRDLYADQNNLVDFDQESIGYFFSDSKLLAEAYLSILSPVEKNILEKLKIYEFSTEDVAKELNLSISNVKVICFRALNKIRKKFINELEVQND